MKFNIGDKVGLIEAPDVQGRIMQCYTSERGDNVYSIKWDEDGDGSLIDENRIVRIQDVTYKFKFEYLENLVVARFYEGHEDGTQVEIGKGHGHIFHDGALGIAQAASYALKKLYLNMENNN